MVMHIGINGFGRIGHQSLRAILERHPDDLKVVAWYDNEWGCACRMADLTHFISEALS